MGGNDADAWAAIQSAVNRPLGRRERAKALVGSHQLLAGASDEVVSTDWTT